MGNASPGRASRAALRAPLVGRSTPHADAGEVHPALLRSRCAGDARGPLMTKAPWVVAGAAAGALARGGLLPPPGRRSIPPEPPPPGRGPEKLPPLAPSQ